MWKRRCGKKRTIYGFLKKEIKMFLKIMKKIVGIICAMFSTSASYICGCGIVNSFKNGSVSGVIFLTPLTLATITLTIIVIHELIIHWKEF